VTGIFLDGSSNETARNLKVAQRIVNRRRRLVRGIQRGLWSTLLHLGKAFMRAVTVIVNIAVLANVGRRAGRAAANIRKNGSAM
jgi:hypothetical protein